jgi:hypothetical protein
MDCKFLRTIVALTVVVGAFAGAMAPAQDVAQLVANRDKKLASPFLRYASWKLDYDEARAEAKSSGRLILGYFTRSYAPCGPCMQLEQGVLSKPEFLEISKGVVLFCHISTHITTDSHRFLFAQKGGNAFPTLMVLDGDGNVLARQCGERSLQAVCGLLAEARAFADLIQHPERSDFESRRRCLAKRIEFGHLDPEQARDEVKKLGNLPSERRAWFDSMIISRQCAVAMLAIRTAPDEAGRIEAAKELVAMKKAGHIPADANALSFWDWVMSYALHTQDSKLYEEGLSAMTMLLPDDPETRGRIQEKRQALDRMKRDASLGGAALVQPRDPSRP